MSPGRVTTADHFTFFAAGVPPGGPEASRAAAAAFSRAKIEVCWGATAGAARTPLPGAGAAPRQLAYSGDRLALEMLKATFNGALVDIPESYLKQARLPYFGTAEMFAHGYREAKAGREVTHVTLASGEQFPLRSSGPEPDGERPEG